MAATPEEYLNLDFEGVEAQESDIPSLTKLLNQAFQESGIDACELAKLLVSQNYVGSVLKPALDAVDYEDEDTEDQPVYSATSIVNLTHRRQEPVVQSIIKFLRPPSEYTRDSTYPGSENLTRMLTDPDECQVSNPKILRFGLFIKERLINMPWTLLHPSLESLVNDVNTAVNKKMPYSVYILLYWSKMYQHNGELHHIDVEDEWFEIEKNTLLKLTYRLNNADTVMVPNDPEARPAIPFRRVYFFKYSQLSEFMEYVKNLA